jgi:Domain of unknown function (DUF6475)
MEDTDKKRFAELMAGLAQTFATDISQQDLENYWRLLRGHPLEQIEQAIIGYCTSPEGHRFMPKPGELISAVHGKQNEQSLLAWVKVTKGIRQAGASKTVIFDDPVIHAVVADLGGWIRLCRLTERELNFQQREFERLYACYRLRPLKKYPRQLTGIPDTANAAAGYEWSQKPVLLGDPIQAALVYKNGTNHRLPSQTLSVQQILQLSEGKLLCKDDGGEAIPSVKEKILVGDHHDD